MSIHAKTRDLLNHATNSGRLMSYFFACGKESLEFRMDRLGTLPCKCGFGGGLRKRGALMLGKVMP